MGNTDRHLNNFGMITDNDTFEIASPSPIFDNGLGLISMELFETLEEALNSPYLQKLCLYNGFIETVRAVLTPSIRRSLINIKDFKFKKHPKFAISKKTFRNIKSSCSMSD